MTTKQNGQLTPTNQNIPRSRILLDQIPHTHRIVAITAGIDIETQVLREGEYRVEGALALAVYISFYNISDSVLASCPRCGATTPSVASGRKRRDKQTQGRRRRGKKKQKDIPGSTLCATTLPIRYVDAVPKTWRRHWARIRPRGESSSPFSCFSPWRIR